jgi:hypothetical protein
VAANKELYVSLPKKQKMLLSQSIVNAVRAQQPPGRFLQKDNSTERWFDVGDKRAQEKTSQALREGAPEIRGRLKTTTKGGGKKGSNNKKIAKGGGRSKKDNDDEDDDEEADDDDEAEDDTEENEDADAVTKPPEIPSIERITSGEQMPPPLVDTTASAAATTMAPPPMVEVPQPQYHAPPTAPPPPATVPSSSFTAAVPNDDAARLRHGEEEDDTAVPPPPPPTMDGENFSFGSIALMSDAEQARLMNVLSQPQQPQQQQQQTMFHNMPTPVDHGLDQTGFSFGSMMSLGTTNQPGGGQRLEKGGLSIGSTMSYTVTENNSNNHHAAYNSNYSKMIMGGYQQQQEQQQQQQWRGDSYGASAAPELTDIGTSFGSLSIHPTERETILREAQREMEEAAACAAMPFLKVQKSRGDLLECSDSDDDDDTEPAMVAQKSANWERLQAAIAAQDDGRKQPHQPQPQPQQRGDLNMMSMPLPPPSFFNNNNNNAQQHHRDHELPMINVPAMTEAVRRDFSNMSAISLGEDFDPQPYALPPQQQQQQVQQQQSQLHYAGGGIGYYSSNSTNNDNNNGYASSQHQQMPEMPLPLASRKKSSNDDDGWGDDVHHRYDIHSYGR